MGENLSTVSYPQKPVYWLIYGLLGWTAAIAIVVSFASQDASVQSIVLTLVGLGLTTVLLVGIIKVLVVHTHANEAGLTLSVGPFVSRTLPWEAINSIEKAPTGGAMDVGWKWMGTGRIGYLAGAENVLIKTSSEFRQRVSTGEVTVPGRGRLAEWYFVSVPDSELTAQRLNQMRERSTST
ncbi:hypothetical protein I2485_00960 [Nesterenkonia sp. E16_7]|uniref:hypothetical protein n=1 Tax=unclassified Nesterenkonia TaxID=2629769 RepID=UPI001A918857|nr:MULTISPECIES: hypothetical protein [unclassified Nesterenkonia]MBO0596547.1 hypothetical protein [Nesterenkonia sp. E16_10]MBO0597218.1 hypothetical protein [Nesterenkonia sp. E16_7]